jgi:hypothetical protein
VAHNVQELKSVRYGALPLDDFEEYRVEYIGRENLQENAVSRRSINEINQ